jgi:predicted transcriptional regulator of viral defense system
MGKTLGSLESKLLQLLQAKDKSIFGLKDAIAITKTSYDATRLLVEKLVKKGWLTRIIRGKYLILSLQEKAGTLKDWYSAASALADPYPYYISHYTALSLHNMTTQPVLIIYISTPKRIANRIISGVKFGFIYCPPKNLWGIQEKWVSKQAKIKISDPEKTIIDALSRPDLCGGLSEIAKAIWLTRKAIDYNILLKYARRFGVEAVSRRLGFILELYGLGNKKMLKELKGNSKSFPLLDPTLPKTGCYSKKWKLNINSDPEELKRIIWT